MLSAFGASSLSSLQRQVIKFLHSSCACADPKSCCLTVLLRQPRK